MIVRGLGRRSLAGCALAALALPAMSGCGVKLGDDPPTSSPEAQASKTAQTKLRAEEKRTQAATARAIEAAPERTVRIDDSTNLSVLPKLNAAFTTGGATANRPAIVSSAGAFRDLCTGATDIAMATTRPTASQLALCAANGIKLPTLPSGQVRGFQIAADAIVLATRNEDSVGGDCLRRTTARRIFKAGSTIDNWADVGFDDRRLVTTGRPDDSDTYQLFAKLIYGTGGTAKLDLSRSDLVTHETDLLVRRQVEATQDRSKVVDAAVQKASRRIRLAESRARAAALKRALADIERANKARAKARTVLSAARKAQIASDNARAVERAKRSAARSARAKIVAEIRRSVTDGTARGDGDIGYFRFTYYELYEDKLRPMEIWDPVLSASSLEASGVATNRSVVVSTSKTIDGDVAGQTSSGKVVEVPAAPTAPGAKYRTQIGNVTVPPTGPVNIETTPNCVFPSARTVSNGAYPLSVRMFAFVSSRGLQRAVVRDYLAYAISPEGQTRISSQRLVPLDPTTQNEQYRLITGRSLPGASGTASSSEATSTTPDVDTDTTEDTPVPTQTAPTLPAIPSRGISGVDVSPPSSSGSDG
jgi:ABC-type phosphate transport system substrate-binding protein